MMTKNSSKQDVVSIYKGVMTIDNLQTTDQELVEYFANMSPELRQDRLISALRSGVIALKGSQISEKIDYIEKKFENLNHKFGVSLTETLQELETMYDVHFGIDGKFKQIMNTHFGEDGILLKEIFDPTKEGTPLNHLLNTFTDEINILKQEFGIKQKEEELKNKTTLKGADFEDHVLSLLDKTAKVFGDVIEKTTNSVGKIKRSKKGDFVATLAGTSKKITFETKDVSTISANEIHNTLDEAIENREAEYGILVVKSVDSISKSIGWFQELSSKKLVVALGSNDEESFHDELLLIAYKWARTRVSATNTKEKQIDPNMIKEKSESIRTKMQKLRIIKTDCNNIEKTSKNIRSTVELLLDEVNSDLDSLNKEIL